MASQIGDLFSHTKGLGDLGGLVGHAKGELGGLVSNAKEELGDIRRLPHDAATSKAWMYPFKGVFFFLIHNDLWRPMWFRLGPSILTAFIVTILMFLFTYIPQVMLFGIFNGPLALVNVFFLVLSESAAITGAITKTMLLQQGLEETFDRTLIETGSSDIVEEGTRNKVVLKKRENILRKAVNKAKAPWAKFTPHNIVSYLIFLPLNFVPIVGTALFIYFQGKKYGPVLQTRYFALKGIDANEAEQVIQAHRGAYTAFGMPATFLEHLTPFFGIFFAFTNTVGAALWAHDLDKELAPDQALRDFKEKSKQALQSVATQLHNRDPVEDASLQSTLETLAAPGKLFPSQELLPNEGNKPAPKVTGDVQQQFDHGPIAQAAEQLQHDLRAQMDLNLAEQVAQNLKAQTDALAGGLLKNISHF